MWKQADQNIITLPNITEWEWSIVDNEFIVKWDSQSNLKRTDKYRKLWINGCKCKSLNKPCSSKNCGCQKISDHVDPLVNVAINVVTSQLIHPLRH